MVDKRESYTKEDLLASGRGELFGAKGPQLPAPNMLMMDRVVKMTETGGNFDKGYVEAELDITYRIHFKRIVNRRLIMGLADGEVLVDGRLIYTANDLKVGLFQDTSAF